LWNNIFCRTGSPVGRIYLAILEAPYKGESIMSKLSAVTLAIVVIALLGGCAGTGAKPPEDPNTAAVAALQKQVDQLRGQVGDWAREKRRAGAVQAAKVLALDTVLKHGLRETSSCGIVPDGLNLEFGVDTRAAYQWACQEAVVRQNGGKKKK
jgi:hypothetical protein